MSELVRILEATFQWTWKASVSATLLFLLVRIGQRLFGKSIGARGCYFLSLLVLVRLLVPFAPSSAFSLLNLNKRSLGKSISPAVRLSLSPEPRLSLPTTRADVLVTHRETSRAQWRLMRPWLAIGWLTGMLAILATVAWRQRRFSQWVAGHEEVVDAALLSMVARAQTMLDVHGKIRLILLEGAGTPALFGWRKPCLLLPQGVLAALSESELMMVLLHELAHIKRRDVLLNWGMIFARALHWFNPLAWLAMRQLRADRELVCDATVLQVLQRDQRHLYGGTLIKLLQLFSQSSLCPTLVPVLHHKHEIKRRIAMIPKFGPSTRAGLCLTLILLGVLCALTFTRAAEGKKKPAVLAADESKAAADSGQSGADVRRPQERLVELELRIRQQQQELDHLQIELAIPSNTVEGSSTIDPETIRMMERERITSDAMAARYQTLLDELKPRTPGLLAQVLPTAVPDAELNQLLRDLNSAESALAGLVQEFGPENPKVKTTATAIRTTQEQIQARVEGILAGLAAQVAAQKASAGVLRKQAAEVIQRGAETAQKYRPYFRAKRDLLLLENVRDALVLELLHKQFGTGNGDRP